LRSVHGKQKPAGGDPLGGLRKNRVCVYSLKANPLRAGPRGQLIQRRALSRSIIYDVTIIGLRREGMGELRTRQRQLSLFRQRTKIAESVVSRVDRELTRPLEIGVCLEFQTNTDFNEMEMSL
jgi:hypothetical protein